ncbi:hypothetical protein [Petropleomorpha daqingensis]|uniref:Uncharacterized protein n=1 Tax=Petropleomorpha daqingensis TaxID=2026353 RepID=A0A853CHX2_9ACTN|nr:hypothetical protein [Petropleomorpha daqingensis]NYJ05868.1 hypothetical protein [Petropleomorpha daqingensis]
MTWVLIVGVAWLAIAAVAALAIARAIHVADQKQHSSDAENFVVLDDDPHVPLRSEGYVAPAADGTVPEPRGADGRRSRGRRSVVRNPVASSERTPHPHRSGAV